MGELDGNLKPSGEGTIFLKTGCIIRGHFQENLLHGKCLVTLPFGVFLVLKLKHGVLDSWMTKIDLQSKQVSYFKYSKGVFEEEKLGEQYTKTLQETFKDLFTPNWAVKDISEFKEGSFFGSFAIGPGQVLTGFIQEGQAESWAITITFWDNPGMGKPQFIPPSYYQRPILISRKGIRARKSSWAKHFADQQPWSNQ